jgi:hypothetical protein
VTNSPSNLARHTDGQDEVPIATSPIVRAALGIDVARDVQRSASDLAQRFRDAAREADLRAKGPNRPDLDKIYARIPPPEMPPTAPPPIAKVTIEPITVTQVSSEQYEANKAEYEQRGRIDSSDLAAVGKGAVNGIVALPSRLLQLSILAINPIQVTFGSELNISIPAAAIPVPQVFDDDPQKPFQMAAGEAWGTAIAVEFAPQILELFSAASPRATFGTATRKDYRRTFFLAYPEKEGQVVVHHAVEQQTLKLYPDAVTEEELNSLENLRGIPKESNADLHLRKIRKAWDEFYESHPNATKQELLDHATNIDDLHGDQFSPPVR